MILHFPNPQTLLLAITSGLLPEEITSAPAEFAVHEDGRFWVKIDQQLEEAQRDELKRLGVSFRKSTRGASSALMPAACWPQLLPLEKTAPRFPDSQPRDDRTPVLFDLPEEAAFADVVSEMLRLGNDRQSFRQHVTAHGVRTLLRVIDPPYYTLLRAIDCSEGQAAPRAYREHSPRVWIEVGYTHPLADKIQPPPGSFLLLSPPRTWSVVAEGKFRDIYEVLRFKVPSKPMLWEAGDVEQRLKVPMRLVRGGTDLSAELWVLDETGLAQLDEFVRNSDDRLLSRLAFAVGDAPAEGHQARTVLVKVRPSKEPPPVLVLAGVACRSYLKIPNLFLPVGYRLHPPLRRDAVKKLLASDGNLITWLMPQDEGQFLPQQLPDHVFRPLSDWVSYVLDTDHEALATWMQSMQFDFESFVCPDDGPDPLTKPRHKQAETSVEVRNLTRSANKPTKRNSESLAARKEPSPTTKRPKPATSPGEESLPPNELLLKLQDLEARFREMEEPPDSPAKGELWREMAETNAMLHHKSEAAICYLNGLWEQPAISAEWVQDWFRAETNEAMNEPMSGVAFEAVLQTERPSPSQLNLLAVHVMQAAFGAAAPPAIARQSLGRVQQLLERFDTYLPIRAAWLTWLGCAELSGGDVLSLARTRDRLLERLYQYGLSPELDLPGFLRSSGPRTGDRFRAVRDCLLKLRDRVQPWIENQLTNSLRLNKGQTAAYADLVLAFGYSRLGLAAECQQLLETTRQELSPPESKRGVREWVYEAFRYRILQSQEGKSRTGPFPNELMAFVNDKRNGFEAIYVVNSLQGKSRILQPHEQVNAHTRFLSKHYQSQTDLAALLEPLIDEENRVELAAKIRELIARHGGAASVDSRDHLVLLAAVLSFAPRLGEVAAQELLEHVVPTLNVLADPNQQAVLLEKALEIAAHYGQTTYVRQFVKILHDLFETKSGPHVAEVFGLLLGQSFRGLRKLGMRSEVSELLEHVDRLVHAGRFAVPASNVPTTSKARGKKAKSREASGAKAKAQADQDANGRKNALTLLLNVAAGWFFFGQSERANAILDEVSQFLYHDKTADALHRRVLACRYVSTLEQAPIEIAIPRFEEIFTSLDGVMKGLGAGIQDNYYASELFEVVEAVVLALVSDEFTLDPQARRVMDEHEFFIRRRIHRDVDHARL